MIMKDKLLYLINHYGKRNQVDVAIEEMSELVKALIKERRINDNGTIDCNSKSIRKTECQNDIREEIVDVFVMLEQLKILFNLKNDELEERMLDKIDRQIERVNNGI